MKTVVVALVVTLVLYSVSTPLFASEEHHRHHDAHEHGVGELNLAMENNDLFIELKSPAANIFGFEHQAQNTQQQQTIKQAMQTLHDGDMLFRFYGSDCQLVEAEVESELAEADEHQQHEEHGGGHGHADVEASYQFSCSNAAALTGIEVKLFELFANTEVLQVQMITPNGQRAVELSHENSRLTF